MCARILNKSCFKYVMENQPHSAPKFSDLLLCLMFHPSGYYAENKLRIEPLTSLALIDLLSDMKRVIDSLPSVYIIL